MPRIVRIPFRWERLQPVLHERLDADEIGRLEKVVERAHAAGLRVVLDMHNYGAYYASDGSQGVRAAIGSDECTVGDFANVWKRLAKRFADDRAVLAHGLMNEPVGLPSSAERSSAELWERASQKAVNAIRKKDPDKIIMVSGYLWSGVQSWPDQHPDAWIDDASGKFRYEAHHYFDRDNSGTYVHTYDEEVADAEARGFSRS